MSNSGYNDIEESLTFERIEFINDNIQEHETILAEHEQKVAEMLANSKREKNVHDRQFQKESRRSHSHRA